MDSHQPLITGSKKHTENLVSVQTCYMIQLGLGNGCRLEYKPKHGMSYHVSRVPNIIKLMSKHWFPATEGSNYESEKTHLLVFYKSCNICLTFFPRKAALEETRVPLLKAQQPGFGLGTHAVQSGSASVTNFSQAGHKRTWLTWKINIWFDGWMWGRGAKLFK